MRLAASRGMTMKRASGGMAKRYSLAINAQPLEKVNVALTWSNQVKL